ncbi:PREDICTED: uncharacterized protein LOC109585424 [Amphimedon queenslandica]|uniref:Uncharacterized protein n=1 Tax=Amphimedon queenslandica TaxID=400682 RepID=A0A1X7TXU1_AMPQE|nr:PREDICTED: uncharacterized protein LOC109585424 [Amphimedon queenslandica]|eukprot:XP_019857061.1 PREDICTED: uncharacterized protein LOC109585424 [Amphimedon queenslandica]
MSEYPIPEAEETGTRDRRDDLVVSLSSSAHSTVPDHFSESTLLKVSPTYFKEVIMTGKVSLAIFLLIVNGLPFCRKSDAINKGFLSECRADEKRPKHGLSVYEFASDEYVKSGPSYKPGLRYTKISSKNCYLRAMNAGMAQVAADAGAMVVQYEGDFQICLPEHLKFKNNDLNDHFQKMFLQLKDKKNTNGIWGIQGFVLFNLWDIGHNRTIYHFLPTLHGHLHHSYSWLFFDLHRDSQNLYKPLGDHMKHRPRLHYLIRSAKLNLPAEKKVCSMFAVVQNDATVDDKILQSVKQDFESAAAQIGVSEIIDFDDVTPLQPDTNKCKPVIQQKMDALISQELRDRYNIPFSFIFLRNLYYKNDSIVYIKKEEVKKVAEELCIVDDKFKEFCEFFTSCGSIIDVSLIDEESEYIVLKPSKFLEEIDKLFHTNDQMLADKGILTLANAERLFLRSHADAYTKILVSFSLAVELKEDQVKIRNPDHSTANNIVWYLPVIRCTTPLHDETKLRRNVLRLLRSYNSSLVHLQASFVTHFLKMNRKSKVCVEAETPVNVTIIEAFYKDEQSITFEVVYFGNALEFRTSVANKEIFSQIISTCHKIMELDIKTNYNFAMLCSKDPSHNDSYKLVRDRHLLPFNITQCDECMKNRRDEDKVLSMWNEAVANDPVKDRILNGDTILWDDASNIANNLKGLDNSTIKVLTQKLEVSLDKVANLSDWKLPMAILMECEKKYTKALSKRQFARWLAEVADEITEPKKDQRMLRRTVNLLDKEILKAPPEGLGNIEARDGSYHGTDDRDEMDQFQMDY